MLALLSKQTSKTSWTGIVLLRAPENSLQVIIHWLLKFVFFSVTPNCFSYAFLIKRTHVFMLNSLFEFLYIQHFKSLQFTIFEWIGGVVGYFFNRNIILFEYFLNVVIFSDWRNVKYWFGSSDWEGSAHYLFLYCLNAFVLAFICLNLRQLQSRLFLYFYLLFRVELCYFYAVYFSIKYYIISSFFWICSILLAIRGSCRLIWRIIIIIIII